ncbi:MAG: fructosamine kinase family protein [Cyanobacteriota bacterium]|nr:fructosamine kinase family protein [Cyanobacteriota bacterium]
MIAHPFWRAVAQHISVVIGDPYTIQNVRGVGGGSINSAYQVTGRRANHPQDYFVKCHQTSHLAMFEAEAAGLLALAATQTVRVPQPICWGSQDEQAYLVLEYLALGSLKADTAVQLGNQLAALHRHHHTQFGWHRHNTIGSTPQINTWRDSWVDFYRDHRLGYQGQLAQKQGFMGENLSRRFQPLLERLGDFFVDYQPQASLLHGDLWSGNYGCTEEGDPVIFDPAPYYGDRESDLAMTELFGGFPADFYRAYQTTYPLDVGYRRRQPLYQLYHLFNHLNLFGGSYLGQVNHCLEKCWQGLI